MLSSSEVAHSDDMKSALETDESYAEYRLSLVAQVTDAAEKYSVAIKDKVVLDLGCFDGAISLGYLDTEPSGLLVLILIPMRSL